MLYMVLFGCCLFLCLLLCLKRHNGKRSLCRLAVAANNLFCIQYLLLSGILIFFEWFSVERALIGVLIISCSFNFFVWLKKDSRKIKKEKRGFVGSVTKQEGVLVTVICLCCIPFIRLTTEDIGTVSDQGAYFIHTVRLMSDMPEVSYQLQEIGKISKSVDEGIRSMQEKQPIWYHYENSDIYYLHALKTWCVFPALFGKMFGLFHCMIAINYIYIFVVCNMFYLCEKIAENLFNVYMALGIFALAPLVLYIGKAGLTEIIMLFWGILGLRYILEKDLLHYILGGVCIGLIGFCHVSIYVYLPLITGIAFLLSTEENYNKIAYFNIVQLLLYVCSIWYTYRISPVYVEKQYARFTMHGKIEYVVLFIGLSVIVLFLIIVQYGIYQSKANIFRKIKDYLHLIKKFLYTRFTIIVKLLFVLIVIKTIYNGYMLGFTEQFAIPEGYDAGSWNLRSRYINTGFQALSYLNIVNIGRATGWIGLIVFAMIPLMKHKVNENTKTFYYMALYGLIIFTVLRVDTPFNYYASRYFLPLVVPMVTITLVSFVSSKNWCIYILCVALMYNHHFWPAFLRGAPQYGQYQIMEDVLDVIPAEEVVLCNEEGDYVNARLTSNLRIINQNPVYNLKNYDEVNEFYSERDKYIISEKLLDIDADLILERIYQSQYSFGNGENGTYDMNVGTYDIPVYIYYVKQGEGIQRNEK